MKIHSLLISLCLAGLSTLAAAQTAAADTVQRDINQETRIRNGLQDGSLTTREAALLERKEAQVDRLESRAMKDGTVTAAERARLNRAENNASRDIAAARHNGVNGDPLSASSQRMQQGVQRDINQQQRIENGLQSGQLTNQEASRLERGQARTSAQQFRAGRDGRVGPGEAQAVNRAQNRQSGRIYRNKHNATRAG